MWVHRTKSAPRDVGRPSNCAIMDVVNGAANPSTTSTVSPGPLRSSCVTVCSIAVSTCASARGVNARLITSRSRSCSGGSRSMRLRRIGVSACGVGGPTSSSRAEKICGARNTSVTSAWDDTAHAPKRSSHHTGPDRCACSARRCDPVNSASLIPLPLGHPPGGTPGRSTAFRPGPPMSMTTAGHLPVRRTSQAASPATVSDATTTSTNVAPPRWASAMLAAADTATALPAALAELIQLSLREHPPREQGFGEHAVERERRRDQELRRHHRGPEDDDVPGRGHEEPDHAQHARREEQLGGRRALRAQQAEHDAAHDAARSGDRADCRGGGRTSTRRERRDTDLDGAEVETDADVEAQQDGADRRPQHDPVLPVLARTGAVRRCRPSDTPDPRISPAADNVPTLAVPNAPSRETRTGPPRKTTLLATASSANAAGSRCRPCAPSSATHRAADTPPSRGMLAPSSAVVVHRSPCRQRPVDQHDDQHGHPGMPRRLPRQHHRLAVPVEQPRELGTDHRLPSAKQPVAAPARAYERVAAAASHKRPRPDIAIPARPTTAVRKKWAARAGTA